MRGRTGSPERNGARGGRLSGRLVLAGGALFCVLWVTVIALVASVGGGSDDEERAAFGGGVDGPARAGERAQEPGADAPDGAHRTDGSRADGAVGYQEVERAEGSRDAREGSGGSEAEESGLPDKPAGTRLPQGAAAGEPAYDPLGKAPRAGDLSETDRGRLRLAAFRFVDAAYDFEGSGPKARVSYVADVNWTVDSPEFWESPESPGGRAIESVAERAERFGVKNSATFQGFRIEDSSPERVTGTAVFVLDEGDGKATYQQELVLRRWAAVWRVLYAKQLEEVS